MILELIAEISFQSSFDEVGHDVVGFLVHRGHRLMTKRSEILEFFLEFPLLIVVKRQGIIVQLSVKQIQTPTDTPNGSITACCSLDTLKSILTVAVVATIDRAFRVEIRKRI